jgi:hypothetical protein
MIDYRRAAAALGVTARALEAVAAVESSGKGFWTIDGAVKPVIRLEAHWFGRLTENRFDESHPHISCRDWSPGLAARTPAGAWRQFDEAAALDEGAAIQATSWGAFQLMGFHFARLGYPTPQAMRRDMATDEGQLEAFVRFIRSDARLLAALGRHDWRAFAGLYNGPGQIEVYAGRMAAAHARAA